MMQRFLRMLENATSIDAGVSAVEGMDNANSVTKPMRRVDTDSDASR